MTLRTNRRSDTVPIASAAVTTADDLARHQQMARTIYGWMARTRATQQALRGCIEEFWRRRGEARYVCDHTLLSRILNPVTPYVPSPARPKAMKILQAAMIICSAADDPNVIATSCDGDLAWSSDEEQAFKIHRARLRHLREQGRSPLHQALHRMGEFAATARWMDDAKSTNELGETYRARAAENVLMTLAAIVDPGPAMEPLSARLAAEGVDGAETARLIGEQVGRVDGMLELFPEMRVNLAAYGSIVLFYCDQQERGMQLLIQAVAAGHDQKLRHDPHWQTLLELLDRLLERHDAAAARWSKLAAAVAAKALRSPAGALLKQAWSLVTAPHVAEHWKEIAPAVAAELAGRKPAPAQQAATPPAPPAGGRKHAKPLGALAAAITGLIFTGMAMAEPAPSCGCDSDDPQPQAVMEVAIRGRESKNGQPPPPPPPPPAAHAA